MFPPSLTLRLQQNRPPDGYARVVLLASLPVLLLRAFVINAEVENKADYSAVLGEKFDEFIRLRFTDYSAANPKMNEGFLELYTDGINKIADILRLIILNVKDWAQLFSSQIPISEFIEIPPTRDVKGKKIPLGFIVTKVGNLIQDIVDPCAPVVNEHIQRCHLSLRAYGDFSVKFLEWRKGIVEEAARTTIALFAEKYQLHNNNWESHYVAALTNWVADDLVLPISADTYIPEAYDLFRRQGIYEKLSRTFIEKLRSAFNILGFFDYMLQQFGIEAVEAKLIGYISEIRKNGNNGDSDLWKKVSSELDELDQVVNAGIGNEKCIFSWKKILKVPEPDDMVNEMEIENPPESRTNLLIKGWRHAMYHLLMRRSIVESKFFTNVVEEGVQEAKRVGRPSHSHQAVYFVVVEALAKVETK